MSEIEVKIRDDKAMLYTPYNPCLLYTSPSPRDRG